MTNNTNGIKKEIKENGQKLETVNTFKYLGATVADEGSKPEVLSKIAQASTALSRLRLSGMTTTGVAVLRAPL